MWNAGDNLRSPSSSAFHLFFETGSLIGFITTDQASNWPAIFRRHTCFSPGLAVPVPAGSPAEAAALTFARSALHQVCSSWPVVSFPRVFTIFPILCSRSVDATSPSQVLPSLPTLATITGSLCNPFCLSFFSSANASWALGLF